MLHGSNPLDLASLKLICLALSGFILPQFGLLWYLDPVAEIQTCPPTGVLSTLLLDELLDDLFELLEELLLFDLLELLLLFDDELDFEVLLDFLLELDDFEEFFLLLVELDLDELLLSNSVLTTFPFKVYV